jgi:hypothetical protein
MRTPRKCLTFCLLGLAAVLFPGASGTRADELGPLATGVAGHAFDHLGNLGDQAKAAAASGATIIYASGFGGVGYGGLPAPDELKADGARYAAYVRDARAAGIRLAIGYVCATSIVKLDMFDRNWTPEFRAQFATPPAAWLQVGRDGKPLASWYGGDYRPACMNNPDWRRYEKSIVRLQLEAGHDGIFFDNPTVHPQGCYCEHCMAKFAKFLAGEGTKVEPDATESTDALRRLAVRRPKDFMRFRCTIAADFLAEIRAYAQTVKPGTLITCNNSLNSPEAFFSQCRTYAYDIHEMSRVEDLVVVEDMATQPRVLANGVVVEYGPVYELLHAISRGKPVVAVTLADADYHTPANLVRLAMAEAAAHGASYLSWPTWPESVRQRMIDAVRPQAEFLRRHAGLLNHTTPRVDAAVFLPFRHWVDSTDCVALQTALALSRANIPFRVLTEDDLLQSLASGAPPALVFESESLLTERERAAVAKYRSGGGRVISTDHPGWPATLRAAIPKPTLTLTAPPTVRALVRELGGQGGKTIVHLFNLNVRRLSSFEDRVTPATDLKLRLRCRPAEPISVQALTADPGATAGRLQFTTAREDGATVLEVTVPRVVISTVLVIE